MAWLAGGSAAARPGQGVARQGLLGLAGELPAHRADAVALQRRVQPRAEHLDAAQARALQHVVPHRRQRADAAAANARRATVDVVDPAVAVDLAGWWR